MPKPSVSRKSSDENRKAVAQIVAAYGWTQREVSERLDVDIRTVQRYLSAEIPTPTVVRLAVEHLAHQEERRVMMAEIEVERRRKGT